jgi:HEPN domain-containing protein
MPNNRTYALEWLELAKHNFEGAEILLEAGHYTDIIGLELQQSIEKTLKALLAYEGHKIERTHELSLLLRRVEANLKIKDEYYDLCDIATTYYSEQRYPVEKTELPPVEEILKVLRLAKDLFDQVFQLINNDKC